MTETLRYTVVACLVLALGALAVSLCREGQDIIPLRGEDIPVERAAVLSRQAPDTTPAAVEESSDARRKLVRMVNAQTAPSDLLDRLHALSALAGVGTPDLIGLLLQVATLSGADAEERRLALRAVEDILRRSHQTGSLPDVSLGPIAEALGKIVSTETLRWDSLPSELWSTMRAMAAVALKQGTTDELRSLLTEKVLQPLLEIGHLRYEVTDPEFSFLAAMLHDERAVQALGKLTEGPPESVSRAEELGRLAALIGDPHLLERARASLGGNAAFLRGFERGLRAASEELDGNRSEMATEMRKGHDRLSVSTVAITPDGSLAHWDFKPQGSHVVASGLIHPVGSFSSDWIVRGADSPDDANVKFTQPGLSQISLGFTVPQGKSPVLELSHIKRADRGLPYNGVAYITVSVDGRPIGTYPVMRESFHELPIPLGALSPGRHSITVQLAGHSTTAYSIQRVRLH